MNQHHNFKYVLALLTTFAFQHSAEAVGFNKITPEDYNTANITAPQIPVVAGVLRGAGIPDVDTALTDETQLAAQMALLNSLIGGPGNTTAAQNAQTAVNTIGGSSSNITAGLTNIRNALGKQGNHFVPSSNNALNDIQVIDSSVLAAPTGYLYDDLSSLRSLLSGNPLSSSSTMDQDIANLKNRMSTFLSGLSGAPTTLPPSPNNLKDYYDYFFSHIQNATYR